MGGQDQVLGEEDLTRRCSQPLCNPCTFTKSDLAPIIAAMNKLNGWLRAWIGIAIVWLVPVGCGQALPVPQASYGTRVEYRLGLKIEFPDLIIEYLGERRQRASPYPRDFLYYDFKIRARQGAEKTVSWTSGTGDIGPIEFEIDGKHYRLELRLSDKLGKLKENELVIWKAAGATP